MKTKDLAPDAAITSAAEFKNVLLTDISADPNQPRTFYDETAMQELTDSVREKGVIQPVLLRPNGKGYLIVCGERRYRASVAVMTAFKNRDSIPAVIRNVSEDEALELQIIENLQRKDVHPMEEAVAFKSLMEGKSWTTIEVAARVGKSDFYVRQRLKLNDLFDQWQKVFFHNSITMTDALKIATMPVEFQKDLFEDKDAGDAIKNPLKKIQISNYDIDKYKGDLHKAAFDLADPTLNPKMGQCTTCPFNTAVANLFADDKSMRCTNKPCFKIKTENYFKRELDIAKEEPEVVLISKSYNDSDLAKKLRKESHVVLQYHGDYTEVEAPENVDWAQFLDEEFDADDDDFDEPEARKEFNNFQARYQKELAEYEKKIGTGKYKKAFVVDSDEIGKYTYIEFKKGSASKTTPSVNAAGGKDDALVDIENINEEIDRIKTREKRSKELDGQKMWEQLRPHFNPKNNLSFIKGELSQAEREAIAHTIGNKINYQDRSAFTKEFKTDLSKVSADELTQMLRFFFLTELPPAVLYNGLNGDATICIKIANQYFPTVLADINTAQSQIAAKRQLRVDKKLSELAAKKKELTKKKPAEKAAVSKPAAKKSAIKK